MKKTFLSVALLSTMALSMPLSFTSCKDYDDDITEINGTTDALQSQLKTIQDAITSNKAIAEAANAAAEASAKAAQEAAQKGDKAAEEAQAAMALAKKAEAAAAQAKADALAEIEAQLKAADAKNQEQFNEILSRLEGVEKGLSGLDADKIDKAVKAVEALQIQLKAFEKYSAMLDELAKYPALTADVAAAKKDVDENKKAVEALKTRVGKNEVAVSDLTKELEKLSKSIKDTLPEGVNTIAGVISQRLTSVTLIPDLYVDGIPTIAFESAKYNSLQYVDGEWIIGPQSAVYFLTNNTTTAQYRLNPGNVGKEDIDIDDLGFVSKIAVSRADEAINDVVAYVPGSGKVENGVLSVNITKPVSFNEPLELQSVSDRIWITSLRVPIAKKHRFANEGAAFVYSEYTRLEETYFKPELRATSEVLKAAGDHFADSAAIYKSTAGKMVGYKLCYKNTLDLNELVQGCAFNIDEADNVVTKGHTPMTLEKLKSYGFDVVFSVAKAPYLATTTDKTNQQAFAKIEGTILTPIIPSGAGDNQAAIGKEPIVHMLLVDIKNHKVADSRYVKIQYTKEEMKPLQFNVASFNADLGCKSPYKFDVTWDQMVEKVLSKYPGNGISKTDFCKTYSMLPSWTITVDGVKKSVGTPTCPWVGGGWNFDWAVPVLSYQITNDQIGALAQGKTRKYVITATFKDIYEMNPDVEVTFDVNITNNIATPTLGATDKLMWTNEVMKLFPVRYDGSGVTVADYNVNIFQGRTNPLVKGLLDCGEWSINLTGAGSTVPTTTNFGTWFSDVDPADIGAATVSLPLDDNGNPTAAAIALVEAESKLTVTWSARLNGLAANTVNFGTSTLQIVKPLKDPVLNNTKELSDNSSTQTIASLRNLLTLKDAYGETVAETTGKPAALWSYYQISGVQFGDIDATHKMMITDDTKGTNPRSLESLSMSATVDANTTKLTFNMQNGAVIAADCYLQIPVQVTHRWGVLTGSLYVKIKHVL